MKNYIEYNEWLDENYLSAEYPTDEEMEMLKEIQDIIKFILLLVVMKKENLHMASFGNLKNLEKSLLTT